MLKWLLTEKHRGQSPRCLSVNNHWNRGCIIYFKAFPLTWKKSIVILQSRWDFALWLKSYLFLLTLYVWSSRKLTRSMEGRKYHYHLNYLSTKWVLWIDSMMIRCVHWTCQISLAGVTSTRTFPVKFLIDNSPYWTFIYGFEILSGFAMASEGIEFFVMNPILSDLAILCRLGL